MQLKSDAPSFLILAFSSLLMTSCSKDTESTPEIHQTTATENFAGFNYGDSPERVISLNGEPFKSDLDKDYPSLTYSYRNNDSTYIGGDVKMSNSYIILENYVTSYFDKSPEGLALDQVCIHGPGGTQNSRFSYSDVYLGATVSHAEWKLGNPLAIEYKNGGREAIYSYKEGIQVFMKNSYVEMICAIDPEIIN